MRSGKNVNDVREQVVKSIRADLGEVLMALESIDEESMKGGRADFCRAGGIVREGLESTISRLEAGARSQREDYAYSDVFLEACEADDRIDLAVGFLTSAFEKFDPEGENTAMQVVFFDVCSKFELLRRSIRALPAWFAGAAWVQARNSCLQAEAAFRLCPSCHPVEMRCLERQKAGC